MHFRRVAHAIFIDELLARADADEGIVRLMVTAIEEMHVIGGYCFDTEITREFD